MKNNESADVENVVAADPIALAASAEVAASPTESATGVTEERLDEIIKGEVAALYLHLRYQAALMDTYLFGYPVL